jgi:hypothetical protein
MKRYAMLFMAIIIIMMDAYSLKTGKVFFRSGVIYETQSPQTFYYTIFMSILAVVFCMYQFIKLTK